MKLMLDKKPVMEQRFLIRAFQEEDAAGVIECFADEYGSTYLNQQVYDPEYIAGRCRSGSLLFAVAQTSDHEIAAIIGASLQGHFSNVAEIGMYIIKRQYRSFKIGMPLIQHLLAMIENLGHTFTALHTHFSTVSVKAQVQLQRLGFVPCGFEFCRFDNNILLHNCDNGMNLKQSLAIAVKKMGKQDVDTLYVPDVHRNFVSQIYSRIGVKFRLAENPNNAAVPENSDIDTEYDRIHQVCTIFVEKTGQDLARSVKAILSSLEDQPGYTANLYLNLVDRAAVRGFNELLALGFYLAGLQPLCPGGEYLVMHNPLKVALVARDVRIAGEFTSLLNYVGRYMDE